MKQAGVDVSLSLNTSRDPRQDISSRGNSSLSHFVQGSPLPNGANCCIPPLESKVHDPSEAIPVS